MIGDPVCYISRVFRRHLQIAGLDVETVGVKYLLVSPVQADDHFLWIQRQIVDHANLHFLEWSQIAYIFPFSIRHVEVKVLVSARITNK